MMCVCYGCVCVMLVSIICVCVYVCVCLCVSEYNFLSIEDESCDSNSDWSSSDDDQTQEHYDVNVGDNTNETFRPTSHMNLKSRWEWLSQNKDQPSPPSVAQKKPRRPPIAPKPKPPTAPKPKLHVIHKTSKVAQESPVTFDEV